MRGHTFRWEAYRANIGDQSLRRSFLQAIAAHYELRALRAAAMDAAPHW